MIGFLQTALLYVVPFLVMITVIVTVHELGHFLVAKACGIAIDRFSIGFGKKLFSRTDKSGVEWRISAIPLGGYVRFAGDTNDASVPDATELDDLRSQIENKYGEEAVAKFYHFKPVWQRALVAAAGPAANFLFAIAIFMAVVILAGDQPRHLARVETVEAGSPAATAGFHPGDVITKVDGKTVHYFEDIRSYVMMRAGEPIRFDINRAGQTSQIVATPRLVAIQNEVVGGTSPAGRLGIGPPQAVVRVHYNPLTQAVAMTWDRITSTFHYLARIVTGKESGDQISGVIGIARVTGAVTAQAAEGHPPLLAIAAIAGFNLLQIAGMISVGLGFANLLPIPVLDGGHLAFYAYEAVARKPVGANIQAASYRVGLALVLGLMLFAAWNDLQSLHAFRFLGGLFT